jgi:chromosome segregation ATPase
MNVQQETIHLYIHPDSGPIMPVELDMLAIELALIQSEATSNRDNARVEAIIDLIKEHFPNVQPEANRQQIRLLLNRLIHIAVYDGVVLRLPGTIDGPPPQSQGYDVADVQELQEEVATLSNQLRSELQSYRDQHTKNRVEIDTLRKENEALRQVSQQWQDEKKRQSQELKSAEDQTYKAEMEAKKYRSRVVRLEDELADLQEELDKERRTRVAVTNLQREVAALRNQVSDANDNEKRIREAQKKLEEENKQLRERIRRFIEEDMARPNPATSNNDPQKSPYLD